jgi:cytochrome c-type biogenesis protein CcmH
MRYVLLLLGLVLSLGLRASIDTYRFDTPDQEASYKRLIAELRCLVCQNQNIADSNAELAQDLRRKTYEMVKAGKGDQEISGYMVQRYGDFVLYQPPMKGTTLLLWAGPFLILALGLLVLVRVVRRRASQAGSGAELSAAQRRRAEELLKGQADD